MQWAHEPWEVRHVDGGTGSGLYTLALWNGFRDEEYDEFARARAAYERCTGSPNPTMEFALTLSEKRERVGPRPTGREAWAFTQQGDTATYSGVHVFDTPRRQEGCSVICGFFTRWRANQRRKTLRCVAKRVWQMRTTLRRRCPPDRRCRRPVLKAMGDNASLVESTHECCEGVLHTGPDVPVEYQLMFALSIVAGIESTTLVAKNLDGGRGTHIIPFTMPLCGQAFLFLGVPPSLEYLPEAVGVQADGDKMEEGGKKEISNLLADGYCHVIAKSTAVWVASLFTVPKIKIPLADTTGALDGVAGGVSEHLRPELAEQDEFRRVHGVVGKS